MVMKRNSSTTYYKYKKKLEVKINMNINYYC